MLEKRKRSWFARVTRSRPRSKDRSNSRPGAQFKTAPRLILLDVDDFKNVNDHFGHAAVDQVLAALGRVLREQLSGCTDVAARLGGEETAWCPGTFR